MSEKRETTVKTECKNGKKVVTTTTVVTTLLDSSDNDRNLDKHAIILDSSKEIVPVPAEAKDKFQKEALERHNHHRKQHNVPPLKWCSKCAEKAQGHADHLAQTKSFAHCTEKGFGENLFNSTSSAGPNVDAAKAVDAWYDEIKDMKFGEPSPKNLSEVGHFTQVVWKDTTHVGMAYAVNGNSVFVVANYLPPGNFIGKFDQHVLPPKK